MLPNLIDGRKAVEYLLPDNNRCFATVLPTAVIERSRSDRAIEFLGACPYLKANLGQKYALVLPEFCVGRAADSRYFADAGISAHSLINGVC